MAELFSLIGELLIAALQAVAAWLQLLVEGLVVLFCLIFSRSYRAKKATEWRSSRRRKTVDLVLAACWLLLIVGLPIYALAGSNKPKKSADTVHLSPAQGASDEDLRIELSTGPATNQQSKGTVVVKKGGVSKLLATRSLLDSKTQMVENVSFIRPSNSTSKQLHP